ncbi:MAG: DUF3017 domain-containing protein [Streptosporangiaceae bacterium]
MTEPARKVRGRRRTGPTPLGDVPGRLAQLPYVLVLTGVVAGLLVAWQGANFRAGAYVISASILFGALARGVLRESQVGMLATRKRTTDVITMGGLGLFLAVVAWQARG